jgi:hypothetical protein
MSSLVVFEKNGVVAEWNKDALYSVRREGDPVRREYPSKKTAISAAKRLATAKRHLQKMRETG